MSTEKRLPADLSALEARLAALRPTEAKLDRDAVLYQAGYQAGLRAKAPSISAGMNCPDASITIASNPNASIPARTLRARLAPRIALASLASATIAASVAVLITRAALIPAPTSQENAQVASVSEGASDVVVTEPSEEEPSEETEVETVPWAHRRADAWDTSRRGSMLALRNAILSGKEIPATRATSLVSTEYDPPKTARQLRAELLPQREVKTPSSTWQWFKQFSSQGETI